MFFDSSLASKIKNGSVGVIPTDTIYGVVASVFKPESLERIYIAKGRPKNKKLIHLVSNIEHLESLGVKLNYEQKHSLKTHWPAKTSIEFDCDDSLEYLHKGTSKIAVRLPDQKGLKNLISKTGPIVATSANLSGEPTPSNIEEIKKKLPGLDFYIEGVVGSAPSKLARINENGELEYLERN